MLELNSVILDAQDSGCGHCSDHLGRAWSAAYDGRACLQKFIKFQDNNFNHGDVI